ncbi:MAG TPA: hypothetical protein VFS00_28970 [Polyangiaceae bacterium]|nr:hypothetical protein [Polyangiaceae bacterium]
MRALAVGGALSAAGCGGAVEVAERNRTFYTYERSAEDAAGKEFEVPYPPLDAAAPAPALTYRGYAVLNRRVRLSRPADWVLRGASDEPGRRYVQYVSPRACLVSIYERPDVLDATWPAVLDRYEGEAREAKAELLAKRIPVASFGSQGRAFVVKRRVPGSRGAYENLSHEIVARGERRVVLVQIVPQGGDLAPALDELQRVLETLEVD